MGVGCSGRDIFNPVCAEVPTQQTCDSEGCEDVYYEDQAGQKACCLSSVLRVPAMHVRPATVRPRFECVHFEHQTYHFHDLQPWNSKRLVLVSNLPTTSLTMPPSVPNPCDVQESACKHGVAPRARIKQNRPLPQWFRLKTGTKIRYNKCCPRCWTGTCAERSFVPQSW